jgi:hypothetical protein
MDTCDPDFRRLKYVRYADDFILGFSGTYAEALEIKATIGQFLQQHLNLTMSVEKTLITQARKEKATFLGYNVSTLQANTKLFNDAPSDKIRYKRRSINGSTRLGVPFGLVNEKAKRFRKKGESIHRAELLYSSVAEIITQYQTEFRGIAEYYKYAEDIHVLNSLQYVMEQSLVKTLAHKLKISVSQVYRKYGCTLRVEGQPYKALRETIETKTGTKTFIWGGIPLKRHTGPITQPIDDTIHTYKWSDRSDLVTRLLQGKCEICGSKENIQAHHIRKLKDLKSRWQGRREKPEWVKRMIALHRKTLIVCDKCHQEIHHRPGNLAQSRTAR